MVVKIITIQSLMLFLIFGVIKASVADNRRSYPSIFQAWSGIENRPDVDELHRLAQHDLAFAHPYTLLRVVWNISEAQPYSGLATVLNSRSTRDGTPKETGTSIFKPEPITACRNPIQGRKICVAPKRSERRKLVGGRLFPARFSVLAHG